MPKKVNPLRDKDKRDKYRLKWETIYLPVQSLSILVRDLILKGYEENYKITCNKWKIVYRVDYAHTTHKHIVEFEHKHHITKLGRQRIASRIRNLEETGWAITTVPHQN